MQIIVSATVVYANQILNPMEKPLSHNNTLETWLAEEREVMARLNAGPGPGVSRPDQVAGKTGLEHDAGHAARRAALRRHRQDAGFH
jgi:hypothetical protein